MLFAGLAAATMMASTAQAATYQLNATSLHLASTSDFSLVFDDLDGDTVFSIDELLSFSGVTFHGTTFFDTVDTAPALAGVTDGVANHWFVSASTGTAFGTAPSNFYTYAVSSYTVPAVPLPASGLLLLGGMGLIAGVKRRRKAS